MSSTVRHVFYIHSALTEIVASRVIERRGITLDDVVIVQHRVDRLTVLEDMRRVVRFTLREPFVFDRASLPATFDELRASILPALGDGGFELYTPSCNLHLSALLASLPYCRVVHMLEEGTLSVKADMIEESVILDASEGRPRSPLQRARTALRPRRVARLLHEAARDVHRGDLAGAELRMRAWRGFVQDARYLWHEKGVREGKLFAITPFGFHGHHRREELERSSTRELEYGARRGEIAPLGCAIVMLPPSYHALREPNERAHFDAVLQATVAELRRCETAADVLVVLHPADRDPANGRAFDFALASLRAALRSSEQLRVVDAPVELLAPHARLIVTRGSSIDAYLGSFGFRGTLLSSSVHSPYAKCSPYHSLVGAPPFRLELHPPEAP